MKRSSIQKFAVAVPILCIVILATFFHFQLYFENVLTLAPETDYGIRMSIWRIVFEPLLGLLLYFNRSIYALKELSLTGLWIFIFYIGFSAIKIFRARTERIKMLLKKLADVFLLIGSCFAIFVLILFIPLPNNTIVNNSKDSILVTTHAHTEFSHDGLTSQENMWKWHQRNGFDAFFITDHANHKKSLAFAQAQKDGDFSIAPLVLVGQEYSASNHMSLLGLNGKFDTKGLGDKAVIDSVHHYGGAVIINHWFDGKGKEKEYYEKLGVDGFEIENVGKDLYYDRATFSRLKEFCEDNQLTMIAGLDFHGYGRVCSLYNAFEIPYWHAMDYSSKQQAILNIIKNGFQEKIKLLLYKDRPFYTDDTLLFRPFMTLLNYFRTLNWVQVLSWAFWLLLFQLIQNSKKAAAIGRDRTLPILAIASAIFMIVLAGVYYFRGEAVQGYSKVYAEYSALLGPIGLLFLLYALVVVYFRFFKPKAKLVSK
ncbi:MAG: PHP domain-containing protein [Flavobacteriaceae bacterium]